jgi:parvulin-like peptidyl-prolyl isomerase
MAVRQWLFLVLIMGIPGCGENVPEGTVALVGERLISQEDLTEGVKKMFGEDIPEGELAPEAKRKVLDALIAAELLYLEGARRGLDEDPAIRGELDELEKKLLVEAFYEREIGTEFEVAEEEIQARFEARGAGEQIRLGHILCQKAEEAEEMLGRLAEGEDFAELARQYSRHTESAPGGGDMGYMGKGLVPAEVLSIVWEMPVGEIAPRPIRTLLGYHVVEVLDRRRQSLEEQRSGLVLGLENEKKWEREREVYSRIKEKYQLEWDPTIAALMAQRKELPEEQVLFRWRGGEFKAADYVREAQVPQPVFRDTARIHRLAEQMVLQELIRLEGLEAGLGELESVREGVEGKKRELMVGRLFELESSGEGGGTERELRAFYEENREKYRNHPRLTIREILVQDESLADSLYSLIQNGAEMGKLARRFTRRSQMATREGVWEEVGPEDPRSATIFRRALAGEGLLPPFKVPGGYSIVEVLNKEKGKILEFAEIEAAVRADLATVRMDVFIEKLRQHFAEEIRVFRN